MGGCPHLRMFEPEIGCHAVKYTLDKYITSIAEQIKPQQSTKGLDEKMRNFLYQWVNEVKSSMKQFISVALTVSTVLLLCACQSPGTMSSTTPQEEDFPISTQGPAISFAPVTQIPFEETESFPFPFEEGLPIGDPNEGFLMSVDQMLYDYDTMWQLLEDNFPFWTAVEQEMGIDWRAYKEQFRNDLMDTYSRKGYITQAQFHDAVLQCLSKFNSVGHLYILPQSYRDSLIDILADSSGTFEKNYLALLSNAKSEQYYELFQGIRDYYSTENEQAGENYQPSDAQLPVPDAVTVTGKATSGIVMGYVQDIPYLKCGTFMDWTEETYATVSDFLTACEDADHIIIDIQGNGGGSTNAWFEGIVPYLTGETLRWDMLYGGKGGALNLWLNPGYMEQAVKDDSWKEDFPNVSVEKLEGLDFVMEPYALVEGKSEFNGQVWLLVDEANYSASEQFVAFSKGSGFAALVGVRTSGNGIGGQPYTIVLPYSGLMIYYEAYIGFNEDGTCNGIVGTTPDHWTKEGQTALDTCLELIKN